MTTQALIAHAFPTRRSSDLGDAPGGGVGGRDGVLGRPQPDRRPSTQIGRAHVYSSHVAISYAVFCLKKKNVVDAMPTITPETVSAPLRLPRRLSDTDTPASS